MPYIPVPDDYYNPGAGYVPTPTNCSIETLNLIEEEEAKKYMPTITIGDQILFPRYVGKDNSGNFVYRDEQFSVTFVKEKGSDKMTMSSVSADYARKPGENRKAYRARIRKK